MTKWCLFFAVLGMGMLSTRPVMAQQCGDFDISGGYDSAIANYWNQHFEAANQQLLAQGQPEIEWQDKYADDLQQKCESMGGPTASLDQAMDEVFSMIADTNRATACLGLGGPGCQQ